MTALFEHSPWVEARADARPSSGDRHADLMAVVHDAGPEEQLALIRAHPELAGKAAIDNMLTNASAAEQAWAGLDRLTAKEFETFHALNAAYRDRFGFPFIICVRLTDKAGILAAMRARFDNDRDAEIAAALGEIGKIVRLRLTEAQASRLAEHEARVWHDLACIGHGARTWVAPRDGVYDVVIVGGGQSGLGAAFALQRERITNILVIDENPVGAEGPWETYARMIMLRTPKDVISIDLGVPSLTFRQYWEAQHGPDGWAAIDKIPRGAWMAYLRWYRRVLDLPVVNEAKLTLVEPAEDGVHILHVGRRGAPASGMLRARKVVLATGIQGGGEWHTPDIVKALPKTRYAHTSEPIDYAAHRNKRIAILGAGASSFDNAQHALTEGVAEAHVFVRREALPTVNPIRFMEASGLIGRFADLDDAAKYRVMASFFARVQPPTNDTFRRAAAWPGFRLHLGAPWLAVEETGEGVAITTPQGRHLYDFLVLSTGLVTDPALRPELRLVADAIVRWGERHAATAGQANPVIDAHPYLGTGFELQARDAAGAAKLRGLFAFNYSGLISLGLSASALSGLRFALPKLAQAVAAQLFHDDQGAMLDAYEAYDEPEFLGATPSAESVA